MNGVLAQERADGTWEALYNSVLRPYTGQPQAPPAAHVQGGHVTGAALDTVDRRIAELRSTVERIGQNLLELDADVTRQMLDASASLAGQTADRWHDAQQRLLLAVAGAVGARRCARAGGRRAGVAVFGPPGRGRSPRPTCSAAHRCPSHAPTPPGR